MQGIQWHLAESMYQETDALKEEFKLLERGWVR